MAYEWVSGAAGAFGSILDMFNQQAINRRNIEMQRETNRLNYQMFKEQNQFNQQMALDQWNRESAYNSPSAQMNRALAAGLNPFSVAGSQSNITGTSNMAPPSSGSPIAALSPREEMLPGIGSRFMSLFGSAASALASLGQAKKAGVETSRLEALLPYELTKVELENSMNDLKYSLDVAYADTERSQDVQKQKVEIDKIIQDTFTSLSSQKLQDANASLARLEKLMKQDEYSWLPKNLAQQFQNLVQQFNLMKAQESQAYASGFAQYKAGEFTDENTKRLKESHKDWVELQSLLRRGQSVEYKKAFLTMWDEINQLHNQKLISDQQFEQAKSAAMKMSIDANNAEMEKVVDIVNGIIKK